MKEEKIISAENLSIGYLLNRGGSSKIIKKDICLNGLKGELIALIGGNGAGKTTLLKTLIGFQPIISGSILIKGISLNHYPEKELARLMSFVSTEIIRVSNLTVYDLIALGRFPHTNWAGRLTNEDRQKVDEAIRLVGLENFQNRKINLISDGERQKAMIARTLAQDTDIILLDEPTAFLDLSNKYEIVQILHKLANERGKTILYSTHDLQTAIVQCDKIWLMLENQVKEGSPEDLILNGSFSSLFHTKNLFFDAEKGDFRLHKGIGKKAIVKGEGIALTWTIKALERIGFEIISQSSKYKDNHIPIIEVSYPSWIVEFNGTEKNFSSLYQVCRALILHNNQFNHSPI
jgi:iron complex transport system ATP-binding protein